MCVFGDTELLIQILTTLIPNSRVSFLTHAGDLESFFLFFFSHILPASREAVKAIWAHAGAELLMKHG